MNTYLLWFCFGILTLLGGVASAFVDKLYLHLTSEDRVAYRYRLMKLEHWSGVDALGLEQRFHEGEEVMLDMGVTMNKDQKKFLVKHFELYKPYKIKSIKRGLYGYLVSFAHTDTWFDQDRFKRPAAADNRDVSEYTTRDAEIYREFIGL